MKTLFAFDLDGTVTTRELLPVIAAELDLAEELTLLTDLTLKGVLDFPASFRLRFHLLKSVPVETVRELVASVPLDPDIEAFIAEHRAQCRVISGNLDCWVEPLLARLGCEAYVSRSGLRDGRLVLESILDKGSAVRALKERGARVIAVGESAADVPMFEAADVGVAYAGVHPPAAALLAVADHLVENGAALCRLLRRM